METVPRTSIEQQVVDAFPAGILIFKSDGAIHSINPLAYSILQGLCSPELIRTRDDFLLFANIPEASANQLPLRHEMVVGGNTYVALLFSVGSQEPFSVVYIADVTAEKRLIHEIHKKTSSVLVGIRTRVTGIQNALSLVVDYTMSPQESSDLVKDSRFEIWLLSRYSDNLKELSLLYGHALQDALTLKTHPVDKLLKEAVNNIQIFRNHTATLPPITTTIDPGLTIRCDRSRLIKIIESLLLNAHIYAGSGNTIELSASADGAWTILRVCDKGFGIVLADQQHIFDYQFRGTNKTRVSYSGMGIELFLAKRNIEFQDGTLTFVSNEGSGTTFELALRQKNPD